MIDMMFLFYDDDDVTMFVAAPIKYVVGIVFWFYKYLKLIVFLPYLRNNNNDDD
jgi:hypothetical protein